MSGASHLPTSVQNAISDLVRTIARGEFDQLVRDGRAGRLTSEELARAVSDYGRTIAEALPREAFELAETYSQPGSSTVAVDLPLWTVEEGRSDLTLSLTLRNRDGSVDVEIDDLHVL